MVYDCVSLLAWGTSQPTRHYRWIRVADYRELTRLLGTKFVARKDVKAVQHNNGAWTPDRTPFTMQDFEAHFAGSKTLGHYMVDPDDNCKLFAFDIDLVKHGQNCPAKQDPHERCEGCFVTFPQLAPDESSIHEVDDPFSVNVRQAWLTPSHPAIPTLTIQLRCLAEGLALCVDRIFDHQISVAIADSGGKGLHVYAFTGMVPAETARSFALAVLDQLGFEATRGNNFFRKDGYPTLDVELFPKQGSLEGKDLGNLMRLPLGLNRKSNRWSTFLTCKSGYDRLVTTDPFNVLNGDSPWE